MSQDKLKNFEAKKIFTKAIEFRKKSDFQFSMNILLDGFRKFPLFHDGFGDYAFEKEIIRTLLMEKKYIKAFNFIAKKSGTLELIWHEDGGQVYTTTRKIHPKKFNWRVVAFHALS